MPIFIAIFGDTLDELGEIPPAGEDSDILDNVRTFAILFAIIGAVAGVSGFVMVFTWSVAGERQVWSKNSAWWARCGGGKMCRLFLGDGVVFFLSLQRYTVVVLRRSIWTN